MAEAVKYDDYEGALALFCKENAIVGTYIQAIEDGMDIDKTDFNYHLWLLAEAKKVLLQEKTKKGFDDALSFTEDNAFFGFMYKDGLLEGDTSKLKAICAPWVTMEQKNNYTHEVGTLLYCHKLAEEDGFKEHVTGNKPKRKYKLVEKYTLFCSRLIHKVVSFIKKEKKDEEL